MFTIIIWDRTSPNFGQNMFAEQKGTNTICTMSEDEAMYAMARCIHNPNVDKAILDGPNGRMTWNQHQGVGENCDYCSCEEEDNDESQG